MTTDPPTNLWRQLFQEAVAREPMPEGPHFVDDNEFLDRWEADELPVSEHEALISHLAACGYCRAVVAVMLREGAVELPSRSDTATDAAADVQPESQRDEPPKVIPPNARRLTGRRAAWAALAAAACLIAIITLWPDGSHNPRNIAALERNLHWSLTDFGYELDGRSYDKSAIPLVDATIQRWHDELRQAVAEFPADPQLRVNYGHLLLMLKQSVEAREQFLRARELDGRSPWAHVGLGLVDYERQQFIEAADHFKAALALDANSFEASLNAAMSLERLGQDNEAAKYWQQAERLAPTDDWRARIAKYRRD